MSSHYGDPPAASNGMVGVSSDADGAFSGTTPSVGGLSDWKTSAGATVGERLLVLPVIVARRTMREWARMKSLQRGAESVPA